MALYRTILCLIFVATFVACSDSAAPEQTRGYPVISSSPCAVPRIVDADAGARLKSVVLVDGAGHVLEQGCWSTRIEAGVMAPVFITWESGRRQAYPLSVFAYFGFRYDTATGEYEPTAGGTAATE